LTRHITLHEIFPNHEKHCITIVHNPRGVQGSNFSYTHEYAYFIIPIGKKTINDRMIAKKDIKWSNLRNWGGESLRSDAKNCFYSIVVNPDTKEIIEFGDVCPDAFIPDSANIKRDNLIEIYPIDNDGVERKWRYARQSVDEVKHLLRARKKGDVWGIEIGKDFGVYKSVWIDTRYDANEYGTKIVKELVPDCNFDFPI
jgi:adenine-specific DNA-methyltransferase